MGPAILKSLRHGPDTFETLPSLSLGAVKVNILYRETIKEKASSQGLPRPAIYLDVNLAVLWLLNANVKQSAQVQAHWAAGKRLPINRNGNLVFKARDHILRDIDLEAGTPEGEPCHGQIRARQASLLRRNHTPIDRHLHACRLAHA